MISKHDVLTAAIVMVLASVSQVRSASRNPVNLADNIFGVRIEQHRSYHPPAQVNDEFSLTVLTDGSIDLIEFRTPAENAFSIPKVAYSQPAADVETKWEFDDETGQYEWEYEYRAAASRSLDDYGDGIYTITFHLSNGDQVQSEVWFGVPGTVNALGQPTQEPVFTTPAQGSALAGREVTFRWEPCTDPQATWVRFDVEHAGTWEDVVDDAELPKGATSYGPVALQPGDYRLELGFLTDGYRSVNVDGVSVEVGKYVQSVVFPTVLPYDVTVLTVAAAYGENRLEWADVAYADFAGILILRRAHSSVADNPVSGLTYAAGDAAGDSTVAYVGPGTKFTDTDLTNEMTYHYRVFTYDTNLHYSQGVAIHGRPTSDADDDGMDDDWEDMYGRDLFPLADDDQDGVVNLIEFKEQLNPVDEANPDAPTDYDRWVIVQPGWNLVSVPRLADQVTVAEFFGQHRTGVAWHWDATHGSYGVADDLPVSWAQGYWVYVQKYGAIRANEPE